MIQSFKPNNIYQVKIDFVGIGVQDVRFIVYALANTGSSRPTVVGRVAMSHNAMTMPEYIYLMAEQIKITPVLLFYLGFEIAEPLPGLDSDYHFVKYMTIKGNPEMIQLVPDGSGVSWVSLDEQFYYKKERKFEYLDEMQDLFREKYQSEFPLRLEEVNHACLYEATIKEWALEIKEILSVRGCISIEEFNSILSRKNAAENDMTAVFRYGLLKKLFKWEVNTLGCMISAC